MRPARRAVRRRAATRPAAASEVIERCEAALWSDRGGRALDWLRRRGPGHETLRRWHVGYQPTDGTIRGLHVRRGIVLPWMDGGRVWQLKVRRPDPLKQKYVAVAGGHPLLFGADTLAGHDVAVLVEGEFDAMLLEQEAGDLVGVATLGSCSKRLGPDALRLLLPVRRLLVALDADVDGEKGARALASQSARACRIRVPLGTDVTDLWLRGGNLRDWLAYELTRDDRATADAARAPRSA